MKYSQSTQNLDPFANNVFRNFTDSCGGDPFELSKILHGKYTVDDFAYHDDFYYFGIVQYFKTVVIPHKIAVFNAGMKLLERPEIKQYLRFEQDIEDFKENLWIHDLSKFSAKEAFGYAMYNRETGSGKEQFEIAWHHHKMHNEHHPEYWFNPNRSGVFEPIPFPPIYIIEMIADWIGAGETYGSSLGEWLPSNISKFKFGPNRSMVRQIIEDLTDIPVRLDEGGVLIVEVAVP